MISLKAGFILFLILLLQIPLFMIKNTITDRQNLYHKVISQVSESWSQAQQLLGPVLTIPYETSMSNQNGKTADVIKNIICLPESLEMNITIRPEIRYKGLFEAVVYTAHLDVKGTFNTPSSQEIDHLMLGKNVNILYNSSQMIMGISDVRRLEEKLTLNWNAQAIAFEPGSNGLGLIKSGIHAADLNLGTHAEKKQISFSFTMSLKGSESINFLPFGANTQVFVSSPWLHPSFSGNFLPDHRQISNNGFNANWKVSKFGRSYPQYFISDQISDSLKETIQASQFGVRLIKPVDSYRLCERAMKYDTLFMIFTFMIYFLFELITRIRIHIFQYGLVGINLCIFFLILVSFSEHIGFVKAYGLGAALIIVQISSYSIKLVQTFKRSLGVAFVLVSLYVYLYIVLTLEEYALLIGTIALFIVLSAVMFAIRNVNWYAEDQKRL